MPKTPGQTSHCLPHFEHVCMGSVCLVLRTRLSHVRSCCSETACFFAWMAATTGGTCLMSSTGDKDITHSTINTLLAMLGAEHDLSAVTRVQFADWKGADKVSTVWFLFCIWNFAWLCIYTYTGDQRRRQFFSAFGQRQPHATGNGQAGSGSAAGAGGYGFGSAQGSVPRQRGSVPQHGV